MPYPAQVPPNGHTLVYRWDYPNTPYSGSIERMPHSDWLRLYVWSGPFLVQTGRFTNQGAAERFADEYRIAATNPRHGARTHRRAA